MSKKNILIILNGVMGKNSPLSGGDIRPLELAKFWQKKNFSIHILSSSNIKKLCSLFGVQGEFYRIANPTEKITKYSFFLRFLQSIFALPKSLQYFSAGIVYSSNDALFDILPAFFLKMKHRKTIRWVAVVHWLPPFPPWKRKQSSLLHSLLFFFNERVSLFFIRFFSDVVLAVSRSTEIQLKNYGFPMNKVKVVQCGVDYEFIETVSDTIHEKKYDAVFMKRIQSVKGAFDLVRIWKEVVRKKQNARLLVLGTGGEELVKLKKMIRFEKLNRHIELGGHIADRKEKIKKLAESKLFILPSYEENWAIVIGEALAAGLPVLAYNLKELKMVWKNYFTSIPLGDTKTFANEIIKYLKKQTSTLSAIKKRNRLFVRQFEWKKIADEEIKIFENIL